MGCCANCDKGLPCDGKSAATAGAGRGAYGVFEHNKTLATSFGQVQVAGHNTVVGAGQTMTERGMRSVPIDAPRAMTPLQAALQGRTMIHAMMTRGMRGAAAGVGQAGGTGGCPPGFQLQNPSDPNSSCVSVANGQTISQADVACPDGQLIDQGTGQCAPICPAGSGPGVRPNNGCSGAAVLKERISEWWFLLPAWQKALVVGVPAAAAVGGVYMLTRKKHKR
jgi:hypothetical protein